MNPIGRLDLNFPGNSGPSGAGRREHETGFGLRLTALAADGGVERLTLESLILAQDERWRRASCMQVERRTP